MNTISGEQLLAQLNWRYATKQFDPARKISAQDWATLENALILSPSSYGLQPWTFIVVNDRAVREKLFPSTWNQRQILDCSHYVVFAVRTKMTEDYVDNYIRRVIEVRGGTTDAMATYRKLMVGDVVKGPRGAIAQEWATRQTFIALGTFMTSAALMGIDTCPMEGFEPEAYDRILDLSAKGLASAVCCAAGFRLATDEYGARKKVRFKRDDVIHVV